MCFNLGFTVKKILLILGLLGLGIVNMQLVYSADGNSSSNTSTLWQDVSSAEVSHQLQQKASSRRLHSFRQLSLNENFFQEQQQKISLSGNALSRSDNRSDLHNIISIPLPNGTSIQVLLEETQVLSPNLATKYPLIKTWKVSGLDDKGIRGRVDFTYYGFHAMLTMPDGDTVFVERDNHKLPGIYNSFSKNGNTNSFKQEFHCDLHGHSDSGEAEGLKKREVLGRAASDLLTYRLAVAATGEYTQYHGGTNNAVSAIATTINRVNQINERDLAVKFEIVNTLIYSNPSTDPYTNGDESAMIEENALNLTSRLGLSGYDIGHVFTQGASSGLALLGSVCDDTTFTGAKAGGITGSPNPAGDAFDVDFVAHELGHQLGATHTFNSETLSCGGGNRTKISAFEPGSGSTIMGYAGICGRETNDLQEHSDAAYHIMSIAQIYNYTRNDDGNDCGSLSAVSNNEPEPNAGADTAIPANTPFVLVGSATDVDSSDVLGYSWEQTDAGAASNVDIDTGDNAIIRSWFPTASAKRYIPRLQDLFDNRRVRGEKLPVADRNLKFALTVRDGVGGFDSDFMDIRVSGTRAFQVTSHQSNENLEIGQNTTVRWDVAGTTSSPVNCTAVDISLLQSNGNEQSLKSQTANDGNESVVIPNSALGTTLARIMVRCSGNSSTFFNISSSDLSIVSRGRGNFPVIAQYDSSPLQVKVGEGFNGEDTLSNLFAYDNQDGNISSNIVIGGDSVNTNVAPGVTYTVIYDVTDSTGNMATTVIREVTIISSGLGGNDNSDSGGGSLDKMMLLLLLLAFIPLLQRRKSQEKIVSIKVNKGEEK